MRLPAVQERVSMGRTAVCELIKAFKWEGTRQVVAGAE